MVRAVRAVRVRAFGWASGRSDGVQMGRLETSARLSRRTVMPVGP